MGLWETRRWDRGVRGSCGCGHERESMSSEACRGGIGGTANESCGNGKAGIGIEIAGDMIVNGQETDLPSKS